MTAQPDGTLPIENERRRKFIVDLQARVAKPVPWGAAAPAAFSRPRHKTAIDDDAGGQGGKTGRAASAGQAPPANPASALAGAATDCQRSSSAALRWRWLASGIRPAASICSAWLSER